ALMLQVMGGRRKLFGDRNPATIDAIEALSQVSESSDDIRAVVEVQEQVLDECIRRLGLDHPITLRAQSALGWTLGKSGDHGRARLLLEGALKSSASLGPKNPLVTLCAWNLYIYLDKRDEDRGGVIEIVNQYLTWLLFANPHELAVGQREIRRLFALTDDGLFATATARLSRLSAARSIEAD